MEEIVEAVKEFLSRYEAQIEVQQEENKITIGLSDPVELSYDEYYTDFYELMKKLGFHPMNGAEYILADYLNYKNWEGMDEFEDDNDNDLLVYYNKVRSSNKTSIFVKRIEITFPSGED